MARIPADLLGRKIDIGTSPSTYESTQNRLFDMRRRLHLRLRDMTEDDLRKVSMCTFDSMMMQLWREGHLWTGRMLTEFVELDKVARKICMLVAPELRRASLVKEKKLLRLLADDLCSAEDAMNVGDNAVQGYHLLRLAEETATRGLSWWWLTERLLKEAAAAAAGARGDGEIAAKVAFATGVFLLDQLHESGEAVAALTDALRLSQRKQWLANTRLMMAYIPPPEEVSIFHMSKPEVVEEPDDSLVKPPLDSGTDANPVVLFQSASAVLCRALLQEARRARIGCSFGLPPKRNPVTRATPTRSPPTVKFTGNPFQDEVHDVEVRTPRILAERTVSATSTAKVKAKLDFIAILKDDISEPEVRDPSKVDFESAASFCREAAQHARNAGRRDLEESALFDLGICLEYGKKYAEALQPLQIALNMYKEDGNSGQEIKTYFEFALCNQRMQRYKEAQEELQKALYRAQETANHPLIFSAHKYLGMFFLNTSQRQYATTHLALALLQTNNFKQRNYERRLMRVLTGLAGANELMPEFISLLRSTESPREEGWNSMLKLLQWREKRTVFWLNPKTSRVVQTLEMGLPPRTVESNEESSNRREAGSTPKMATETEASVFQPQSDEDKHASSETEGDTLTNVRTETEDELPKGDSQRSQ